MSFKDLLRSSEFWIGLATAICQFLISQHILNDSQAQVVKETVLPGFIYTIGRLVSKVAKKI